MTKRDEAWIAVLGVLTEQHRFDKLDVLERAPDDVSEDVILNLLRRLVDQGWLHKPHRYRWEPTYQFMQVVGHIQANEPTIKRNRNRKP